MYYEYYTEYIKWFVRGGSEHDGRMDDRSERERRLDALYVAVRAMNEKAR